MESFNTVKLIDKRIETLCDKWRLYNAKGKLAHFTEFAISINCLTECFNTMRLPGMVRLCEALEISALDKLSDATAHPLPAAERQLIDTQLITILAMAAELHQPIAGQRKQIMKISMKLG